MQRSKAFIYMCRIYYLVDIRWQGNPAILIFDNEMKNWNEDISLVYTSGLYTNEGKIRVTVMHIENFTKPL
jgi:hypothetical protein